MDTREFIILYCPVFNVYVCIKQFIWLEQGCLKFRKDYYSQKKKIKQPENVFPSMSTNLFDRDDPDDLDFSEELAP